MWEGIDSVERRASGGKDVSCDKFYNLAIYV